jgi:acyl carrier protein
MGHRGAGEAARVNHAGAYDPSDAAKLKQFIREQIIRDPSLVLRDDQPLMSSGLIDSFALVDLSVFIETAFGVRVPDVDLMPERMDTVAKMLVHIDRLRRQRG